MDTLTLNCWVRSRDAGQTFQVKISKTETVYYLKKAIKNKKPVTFRDTDADALHLYKPKVPVSSPHEESLAGFMLSEHGQLLEYGDDELFEVFPEPPPKGNIHIVVDWNWVEIECLLRGANLDARCQVSIRASATITQLKQAIKKILPSLRDVDGGHICLFRMSGDDNELREYKTGHGQPLQGYTLAPNFLGVPVLDSLLVVVEVSAKSTYSPPLWHRAVGGMDPIAEARRAFIDNRLPKQSPSDSSKPSAFHEVQQRTKELILCGRPRDPEEVIPVTLLHPVFGQFLDDCQNGTIPVKEDDNRLAGKLANAMSSFHVDEKQRVNAVAALFEDVHLNFNLYQKIPGTSYTMDASLSVDRSDLPPYFIGEFKNEAAGKSEPYMQAIACYLEATRGPALKWLKSPLPCFLLVVFGPYMVFAGAVWNLRPVVQVLSTPLAFHYHSTDIQNQLTVARHMAAFRNALRTLESYYQDFVNEHQCNGMLFPYPTEFTCLTYGIPQHVCYTNQLMEWGKKERLIFFGTLKGNAAVQLCIKFTRRYSKEVHQRCVDLGFAPKLRGFKELPGGWYMVVMDDVARYGYQLLSELSRGERLPKLFFDDIKNKLEELHASHLVHGDIRDTNIFVKKGCGGMEFMIFDFDWAGKIDDIRYPPYVNHTDIRRPTEARDGLLIKAAHDLEMLDVIIDVWAAEDP